VCPFARAGRLAAMTADLRWHQRFENLQRAMGQLQAAVALISERYWPELQWLRASLQQRVRQEAQT